MGTLAAMNLRYHRRTEIEMDWFMPLLATIAMAIAAAIFGGLIWLFSLQCNARWAEVGETSFGPLQGCMVRLSDGRRLPSSALRDISP